MTVNISCARKKKLPISLQSTSKYIFSCIPSAGNSSKLQLLFHLYMRASSTLKSVAAAQQISKLSPYFSPDQFTEFLNCSQNLKHATQIHAQLITRNYLSSPFLFNKLLGLYSECGQLSQAVTLFSVSNSRTDFDDTKNVFTYTSIISKLCRCNLPFDALMFFIEMRERNIYPNHFTFSAILPVCGDMMMGKQMHSLVLKHGFESDVFVSSALVDMYAKLGDIKNARSVFDEMPDRNLVSWNSVIVGFLRNGHYKEAISFFASLIGENLIRPDEVSFSSVLIACSNLCVVATGRQVHGTVTKNSLEILAYVKNSLMDMYCKCGVLDDAKSLFSTMKNRDVVTWNIMAMGCAQNGSFEEACNHFWVMIREGILADEVSFSTVLRAAANMGNLDQGSLIHNQIIKSGFGGNKFISCALIAMYSKCGSLIDARRQFSENEEHNVKTWTAMISAFQQHGCANQVMELFDEMLLAGMEPDYITFVSVLSACGHTGHVDYGFYYFNMMSQRYNISPGLEHYACMVDLLGRAGRLHDAMRFVEAMPIEPDASVWGALLGACREYGNLDMGKEVAERLFQIEPDNPGNYVLLYNMYARRGRLEEANEVRRLMGISKIKKEPGCSWLDVKNATHLFKAHDRSHSSTNDIYDMLGELEVLVKKKKCVPDIEYAITEFGECTDRSLWYHSEKLALAYGLLVLPVGAPVRIKKNLRTCGHCHAVMKLASEIFKRQIILRDINRFHHFSDGLCSCGDYW